MSSKNSNFIVAMVLMLLFACLSPANAEASTSNSKMTLKTLRQTRSRLAQKKRVVFNNDGCDAEQLFPKKWRATPDNLLKLRGDGLLGTDVTTISYCSASTSFSQFTHNTTAGEIQKKTPKYWKKRGRVNIVANLLRQSTDPFRVYVEFARKHNLEIFWSRRMNDTHDVSRSATNPYSPHWSKFKETHPEYLFGKMSESMKYGRWSAVDFSYPEIRKLTLEYFREICENYDIDGIEMDYFRHLFLFRNVGNGGVATKSQLDMLTDMMREIRTMTEEVGLKRGRPILVSIRVPDSVAYCKKVGIDLERWCDDDLIDIVIGSGYFRLNSWRHLADFGRNHHVQTLAGLSDPRVSNESVAYRRLSNESYRARAMDAWRSGVDGLYIFNEYYPDNAKYLKEIGSIDELRFLNKLYFTAYMTGSPEEYLNGGDDYLNIQRIYPGNPLSLPQGIVQKATLNLGDDFNEDAEINLTEHPICVAHARIAQLRGINDINVSINGNKIDKLKLIPPWLHMMIPSDSLKPGINTFKFTWAPKNNKKSTKWDMEYKCDKKLTYPSQLPWRRLFSCDKAEEKIVDASLLLSDMSNAKNQMNNLAYPWRVDPNGLTIVETSMRLIDSSSPLGVCLRLANGVNVEYLTFSPDGIALRFADIKFPLKTTDGFKKYRIEMIKHDIKVFVDGKLAINGTGRFTTSINDPRSELDFHLGNAQTWNASSLIFGSCSGGATGSALWKFIRFRSSVLTIDDFALSVDFTKSDPKQISLSDMLNGNYNIIERERSAIAHKYPQLLSSKFPFDHVYDPESGLKPNDAHNTIIWKSTYKTNAKIVYDKLLKHRVLALDHTDDLHYKYSRYCLWKSKQSEESRFLIMDFSMRMSPKGKKPQLHIAVSKHLANGLSLQMYLRFHPEWIQSSSEASAKYALGRLGNEWHEYRIIVDFKNKRFEVHVDNRKTPIIDGRLKTSINSDTPCIAFGDGSSAISGQPRLGFFKWRYLKSLDTQ